MGLEIGGEAGCALSRWTKAVPVCTTLSRGNLRFSFRSTEAPFHIRGSPNLAGGHRMSIIVRYLGQFRPRFGRSRRTVPAHGYLRHSGVRQKTYPRLPAAEGWAELGLPPEAVCHEGRLLGRSRKGMRLRDSGAVTSRITRGHKPPRASGLLGQLFEDFIALQP